MKELQQWWGGLKVGNLQLRRLWWYVSGLAKNANDPHFSTLSVSLSFSTVVLSCLVLTFLRSSLALLLLAFGTPASGRSLFDFRVSAFVHINLPCDLSNRFFQLIFVLSPSIARTEEAICAFFASLKKWCLHGSLAK